MTREEAIKILDLNAGRLSNSVQMAIATLIQGDKSKELPQWSLQEGPYINGLPGFGDPEFEKFDYPIEGTISGKFLPDGFRKDRDYYIKRHGWKITYQGYEIDFAEILKVMPLPEYETNSLDTD